MPAAAPRRPERVPDHDQLLLHIGMDPTTPQVLGATVEFYLGGQPIVFNTTTSIFIPKGTPYGPITWKEFQRPHVQVAIVFGSGNPHRAVGWRCSAAGDARVFAAAPRRRRKLRLRAVRGPQPHERSRAATTSTGRQNPTMTYLSRTQVAEANNYLEFGWIWDVPSPPIPKMRHDELRRDRAPHRQRPRPSRGSGRRPASSASATTRSSSTPPTALSSPRD